MFFESEEICCFASDSKNIKFLQIQIELKMQKNRIYYFIKCIPKQEYFLLFLEKNSLSLVTSFDISFMERSTQIIFFFFFLSSLNYSARPYVFNQ